MTWQAKTHYTGGGDNPLTSIRHYTYWHFTSWKDWFRRSKVKIDIPFECIEKNTCGDENGHRMVLSDHPFYIRGQDVMAWAQTCVTRGFATFDFQVDASAEHLVLNGGPQMILRAKFTDKSIGALFKLTFGGKF